MANYENLIQAWISRYQVIQEKGDEAAEAKLLFWAFEQLNELCWEEPVISLNITLAILDATNNEYVLDNLAAGPLESILSRHGLKIIELIESEADRNKNFQKLLGGVWKNEMSDDIWKRVQHAALDIS